MKILLINVDAPEFNIAIRKLFNYYKKDHEVTLIDKAKLNGYPNKKNYTVDASGYDKVIASMLYEINRNRFNVVGCDDVVIGGIGSYNETMQLDPEIESTKPYYFTEEKIAHGSITRGCINKCTFCKVPKVEGPLRECNRLADIYDTEIHDTIRFYDNTWLAYKHSNMIMKYLIVKKIRCDFNQGLDMRLINDENAKLLSELNYRGEYIFAFDDIKYKKILEEKLKIAKKYISKPWKIKFYTYHEKAMKISDLIERVEWCRNNECLPYVMRNADCWESEDKNFLIDYAAYCNQPSFFKKMDFLDFLYKRHTKQERIKESLRIYEANM